MAIRTGPSKPPSPLGVLSDPRRWMLDADWAFLNHGSFGSRLRVVQELQNTWMSRFERHPVRFLDEQYLKPKLDAALAAVGRFLNADPAGLVFVSNVTDAVATVLASAGLSSGDEVLTTSHAYGAVLRAIEVQCSSVDATPRVVSLPCPVPSAKEVESIILSAVTSRTRLVVLDQVTSPTALRLPLESLIPALRKRRIQVFVDGAHAGGMLVKPFPKGATWWSTNLHKWGLAPLGCAVLWTARSHRARTRPLAPSHAHFMGYQTAFSWQGTRDVSPWLTAPDAIAWVRSHGGWAALRRYNAAMARWTADRLVDAWGTTTAGPRSMRQGVSMVTVQLPASVRRWKVPDALRDALANEHKIEVPIWKDGPRWWLRVSCQAYTRPSHVERLINGIKAIG